MKKNEEIEDKKQILKRDRALIKNCLKGDSESFASLMSLYMNRVKAVGYKFNKKSVDVEDFCQDVFLKVFKNLKSFRGDSSFATWITRIAYTTAINSIQNEKTTEQIPDGMDFVSTMATPEEQQIRNLTQLAVNEAVKNLPRNYSICLELYFFHDLSHEEISTVTGFPINTIKSHIFRAKKILRQKLMDFSSL